MGVRVTNARTSPAKEGQRQACLNTRTNEVVLSLRQHTSLKVSKVAPRPSLMQFPHCRRRGVEFNFHPRSGCVPGAELEMNLRARRAHMKILHEFKLTFRHPQHDPAIGGFKDLAILQPVPQEEFVRRKVVSTLSHYVLTGGRQPEPNNWPRRHPCYLVLVSFIFPLDLWPEEARHGEKEGAREGGEGLGREQGACSACSSFFRGLREISSFVHNQG